LREAVRRGVELDLRAEHRLLSEPAVDLRTDVRLPETHQRAVAVTNLDEILPVSIAEVQRRLRLTRDLPIGVRRIQVLRERHERVRADHAVRRDAQATLQLRRRLAAQATILT